MGFLNSIFQYFASLRLGRLILWLYLIWYLVTVAYYFDPSPSIWLNALGISAVIGFALMLSINHSGFRTLCRWQIFRLFMMPFCVSSFSSLIKGQDFFLVIPPHMPEVVVSVSLCASFMLFVFILKQFYQTASSESTS